MSPTYTIGAFMVFCVLVSLSDSASLRGYEGFSPWWQETEQLKNQDETVPVIPLTVDGIEKVSEKHQEDFLAFFPKDVLQSDKQFKPVKLRVVEHEDFIDYEFDFVEADDPNQKIEPRKVHSAYFSEVQSTEKPLTTSSLDNDAAVTFANLLERARLRHRQKKGSTTTPMTTVTTTTTTAPTTAANPMRNRFFNQKRMRHRYFGKHHQTVSPKPRRLLRRPSSLFPPETTTDSTTTTTTTTVPTTTLPTTTSPMTTTMDPSTSQVFTNVQTVSALVVTRNVTSTRVVTAVPTQDTTETPQETTTTYQTTTEVPDYEEDWYATTFLPLNEAQRIPRIIDSSWEEEEEEELSKKIFSGQYHEVNPGQYMEVNPGQYHEVNPGQYYEVNPGQYKKEEELKVEVEVERSGNKKVYNVQSKVDKFIIGEFGTISEQNGQTLQGVRYTAVADSAVDTKLIYETLHKFFSFS